MQVDDGCYEIVALRKSQSDQGFDAGPSTILYYLANRPHRSRSKAVPSVATIWRVLSRRGFVGPEPHKRPRSSWRRFQADLPNQCWQADTTHVLISRNLGVEVLNMLDDNSRRLVASRAFKTTKAVDVMETFHQAAGDYGLPASVLTANGRGRCCGNDRYSRPAAD
jgi:transposase InsO family protein